MPRWTGGHQRKMGFLLETDGRKEGRKEEKEKALRNANAGLN